VIDLQMLLKNLPSALPVVRRMAKGIVDLPMLNGSLGERVTRERNAASLTLWLQHDLDAAIFLVAECLVHLGSSIERHGVRDHK
jgi:hypothetical protein